MRVFNVLSLAITTWLVLLLVAASPPASRQHLGPIQPDTTVVDSISAGAVLIRALPKTLRGDSVLAYEALRIPALGWLRDRSFFWRAPAEAEGNYRFVFEARLKSGASESVYVRVFVIGSDL